MMYHLVSEIILLEGFQNSCSLLDKKKEMVFLKMPNRLRIKAPIDIIFNIFIAALI